MKNRTSHSGLGWLVAGLMILSVSSASATDLRGKANSQQRTIKPRSQTLYKTHFTKIGPLKKVTLKVKGRYLGHSHMEGDFPAMVAVLKATFPNGRIKSVKLPIQDLQADPYWVHRGFQVKETGNGRLTITSESHYTAVHGSPPDVKNAKKSFVINQSKSGKVTVDSKPAKSLYNVGKQIFPTDNTY